MASHQVDFGSLIAVLVISTGAILCIIVSGILITSIRHTYEVQKRGYTNAMRLAVGGIGVFCINVYETGWILRYLYNGAEEATACANTTVAQNFIVPLMLIAVQRQFARYYEISQRNRYAAVAAESSYMNSSAKSASKQLRTRFQYIFLTAEILSVTLAIVWTFIWKRDYETNTACVSDQLNILPALLAVVINIILTGIFVVKLRHLNDGFGMRQELIIYFSMMVILLCLIIWMSTTSWVHSFQMNIIVNSGQLIFVYFALIAPVLRYRGIHLQSLLGPLLGAPSTIESINSQEYMASLLKDRHVWNAFQKLSQRQCCPELLLFRQAINELRTIHHALDQGILLNVYDNFVATGSDFELNLISNTHNTLKNKARDHTLELKDFDTAYMEMEALLFRNIYPLYLKSTIKSSANAPV